MEENKNYFKEGVDTFITWYISKSPRGDVPDNPYSYRTKEYEEWDIGFNDASEYMKS